MPNTDPPLDLDLPTEIPDLPPPWLPNDAYLSWMREEWQWLERDGRWEQVLRDRQQPVEEAFNLP
jgi:hypothetical protein